MGQICCRLGQQNGIFCRWRYIMAKILIVEDELDVQKKYQRYLGDRDGHELLFAATSKQGIEALSQNADIDLVILDHVLQGGIGCEEFVSHINDVWRNQRQQKIAKKPILVTASSVLFNLVGAERVFRKYDLLDNLRDAGPDNDINKLLRENGLMPNAPSEPVLSSSHVLKKES
jgi:CheY-like chemotaxis protein